jgi:hypothetical protein
MPVAFVQEFAITDRSTKNYDSVKERLGGDPIDGLIIHTAGFDDDNNVFRIVDVWESREQADRFLERVMTIVGDTLPADVTPPTRESFYELHDLVKP